MAFVCRLACCLVLPLRQSLFNPVFYIVEITMKKVLVTTLCLVLAACSTTESKPNLPEKSENHLRNWSLANDQRKDDSYNRYLKEIFLPVNNKHRLDERNGCYSLSHVKVELILHISKRGVIEKVSGWPNNEKLRCFKKTYNGLKLPVPPKEAMLLNMIMG